MTDTATAALTLHFETAPCGRCDGDGEYHAPTSWNNGKCFTCHGAGILLTRRGRTARNAYDALVLERLTIPATDLGPGMRILSPALSAQTIFGGQHKTTWRTIATVEVTDRQVDVHFEREGFTWYFVLEGDGSRARVASPENRAAAQEIARQIAKKYTGAWLDGEEAPAPSAPRTRKPAEPKAAPAPRPMVNRFPGQCARCGGGVPAQSGRCTKTDGGWDVHHNDGECPDQTPGEAPAAPVDPATDGPADLSGPDNTPAAPTPADQAPADPAAPADQARYLVRKGTYTADAIVWELVTGCTGEAALERVLAGEGIPAEAVGARWLRRGTQHTGTVWYWTAEEPATEAEQLLAAYVRHLSARDLPEAARRTLKACLKRRARAGVTADAVDAREALRDACKVAWDARCVYSRLREQWAAESMQALPWDGQPLAGQG